MIHELNGSIANALLGWSVAGLGDVNGDGRADFAVGAPGAGGGNGEAAVRSGLDASVLFAFVGDGVGDGFGATVSNAGDVDGDAVNDLIVGAPNADLNGLDSGTARVFSGATGAVLHTFVGFAAGDSFGGRIPGFPARAAAGAGDVDGDAFDDLIVGASLNDTVASNAGAAYVFSGATGTGLLAFYGDEASDGFGFAVSGAGDIDGDGRADVMVGAPFANPTGNNSGRVRIFSGADGHQLAVLEGVPSVNGVRLGSAVARAGDVNGDGTPDLIVGSPDEGSGAARVYSGYDLVPCVDGDGDGYGDPSSPQCTFGGRDCDDADAAVNPGAPEIPGNGKDDDCNPATPGGCTPAETVAVGAGGALGYLAVAVALAWLALRKNLSPRESPTRRRALWRPEGGRSARSAG